MSRLFRNLQTMATFRLLHCWSSVSFETSRKEGEVLPPVIEHSHSNTTTINNKHIFRVIKAPLDIKWVGKSRYSSSYHSSTILGTPFMFVSKVWEHIY